MFDGMETVRTRLNESDNSLMESHSQATPHSSRQSLRTAATSQIASIGGLPPSDRFNLVYFTFLLYGIGALLPLNIILGCLDFAEHKVRPRRA